MKRIRQSDLAAYARCPRQKKYYDLAKIGQAPRPRALSRTVYGTVMHHALRVMEEAHHNGEPDALAKAEATFTYYWHPDNIAMLAEPVEEWLAKDTWGGFQTKGLKVLRDYYDLLQTDDSKLLALEYQFEVPIELNGEQHILTGTVDRLAIRRFRGKPYIAVDDYKTGRKPTYLRYNAQFTTYCYASTQREFWANFHDGDRHWATYRDWPRRGRWIDVNHIAYSDAGWRGEDDYARLKVALAEYVRACDLDVFPLTLSGESCTYCPFRDFCAGVPVPDEGHGGPA